MIKLVLLLMSVSLGTYAKNDSDDYQLCLNAQRESAKTYYDIRQPKIKKIYGEKLLAKTNNTLADFFESLDSEDFQFLKTLAKMDKETALITYDDTETQPNSPFFSKLNSFRQKIENAIGNSDKFIGHSAKFDVVDGDIQFKLKLCKEFVLLNSARSIPEHPNGVAVCNTLVMQSIKLKNGNFTIGTHMENTSLKESLMDKDSNFWKDVSFKMVGNKKLPHVANSSLDFTYESMGISMLFNSRGAFINKYCERKCESLKKYSNY